MSKIDIFYQLQQTIISKNPKILQKTLTKMLEYDYTIYSNINIVLPSNTFDQTLNDLFNLLLQWLKNEDREYNLKIFQILIKFIIDFYENNENWFDPFVRTFSKKLKDIIINQCKRAENYGNYILKKEIVESGIQKLQEISRRIRSQTKSNKEKYKQILFINNLQFFLYFKINDIYNCRSLEEDLNQNIFYQLADIITYQYYISRLKIQNNQYQEAKELLINCLQQMKGYKGSNKFKMQKQILKYLIPINLYFGIFPSHNILSKFQLLEYKQICQSLKLGNFSIFLQNIEKYAPLYFKRSIYFLCQHLKLICLLQLIKKVYYLNLSKNKIHQLDENLIIQAIQISSQNQLYYENLELQEDIIKLKEMHYINVNITHKQLLVFKKEKPFPQLFKQFSIKQ